MKASILFALVLIIGCSQEIPPTSTTPTMPPATTTTTLYVCNDKVPVSYSAYKVRVIEDTRNITKYKRLKFQVHNLLHVTSFQGIDEYIFWPNQNFNEFSRNISIKGMYEKTGVAELANQKLNQTITITNKDSMDGIFLVERIFPGLRDGYYIANSSNVKTVPIAHGETVEVEFDQGVICHSIAQVHGDVNIMPYFIEHTKTVRDQKDFIVVRLDDNVLACERAHYRVFAPLVKYSTIIDVQDAVIANEQGTDNMVNRCNGDDI